MARNATAKLVEPNEEVLDAGEFYFVRHHDEPEPPAGIIHACPCGCGGRSALWFRGRGRGQQEWDVSGEWPAVTLSPSIGIKYDGAGNKPAAGSYHWHGYLRNGVFEEG